jgi:sterol desaturase/sphingolipid hydroxylase (fatty acid hydroxylase superfamily)
MNSVQRLAAWALRWQAWVPIGVFIVVAAWEAWRPDRRRGLPLGWRWATNLGLYFGDGGLMRAIGPYNLAAGLLLLIHVPHLRLFFTIRDLAGVWSVLIMGCTLLDLMSYLLHRLSHRFFTLWRIHAVHHADTDVDASTAVRHHPLEVLFVGLATLLPALFLGIPAGVLVIYSLLALAVQLFQHANLRLPARVEVVLGWIVMTPGLHRTHHSVAPEHYNANFGTVLSVWDRLLGTLTPPLPEGAEAPGFGVSPFLAPRYAHPHWALLLPFVLPHEGSGNPRVPAGPNHHAQE